MPVCLCVLCVCVCGLCLCLFLCAPLGLPTLPHDPPTMWTGTELLSAHIRQEDSRTTHNTRSPAAIRSQGKRRQSGKRYTGHHHHHHPPSSSHCDSGKCHHAASSLALPILRAPLVADAPHVYLQNLEWVHRYNTKVPFLTRLTPPLLSSGTFHCVRAHLYFESGPPCPSSSPLCGHCLRGTAVPAQPSLVQPCLALPCPAMPLHALVLETSHPCSLCTSDWT